jgi:hypothetical protein
MTQPESIADQRCPECGRRMSYLDVVGWLCNNATCPNRAQGSRT